MRFPVRVAMFAFLAVQVVGACPIRADDLLYRYEGDVLPYADSGGWINGNPCETPCSESIEDGHYVLRWPEPNDVAGYAYLLAEPPNEPPPTLWVEWRFRSNHPIGPSSYTCDGRFSIKYGGMIEDVWMYGDAALPFSADSGVSGLAIDEFHTFRFESLDGMNYRISVDGLTFIERWWNQPNGYHRLQFSGRGGCTDDWIPDNINEWDFIRFGTISYGEQIILTDPLAGFLDARRHADLDRFTITFDSPNYVYLDEIAVEVTGGESPIITQTRRRENDGPEIVEIVLNGPLAMGETTRFTFSDGVAVNIVEYTFAPADTDGDGDVDLRDFSTLQTCFGSEATSGACRAIDLIRNGWIELSDHAAILTELRGPGR